MTAIRVPGTPAVEDGALISSNPATGVEVGRFPVAGPADVVAAVVAARKAALWWDQLGFAGSGCCGSGPCWPAASGNSPR